MENWQNLSCNYLQIPFLVESSILQHYRCLEKLKFQEEVNDQ